MRNGNTAAAFFAVVFGGAMVGVGAFLLTLALMCEARASDMPPFKLDHPICPGGFTIAQRYDQRNAAGTIIKSVWVRKCTKGKIIYGGKV